MFLKFNERWVKVPSGENIEVGTPIKVIDGNYRGTSGKVVDVAATDGYSIVKIKGKVVTIDNVDLMMKESLKVTIESDKSVEDILDSIGLGTGREYQQGTDICICPECGYEEEHIRGESCNTIKCPECNIPLTGKGAPGEIK